MNKAIWIINDYAGSPAYGLHLRHYYLARQFVGFGYKVSIISGSYSHLLHDYPVTKGRFTREEVDGISYVWVKVPKYTYSDSYRRLFKWLVFSFSLPFLCGLPKPDVILAAPTSTYPILPAWFLAKKYNARFILEVRDIWPLTIVEIGNVSTIHPLVMSMSWLEKFGINKCDHLVSNLINYGNYLQEKGLSRSFTFIPNGVDLKEMSEAQPLNPSINARIPGQDFVIGYAGAVGRANALDNLLEAAEQITHPNIKFVIVGKGQEKDRLIKKAEQQKNVCFLPAIPKNQIQTLLAKFSVCYIGWNCLRIYKYGVAANKMFDYMFAAKPIIHAYCGSDDLVRQAKCGITVEAGNPDAIAKGVMLMYQLSDEQRDEMGNNGKNYVLKHHSYDKLATKYIDLFES